MKLLWLIVLGIALSCGGDNRNSAKANYELRVLGLANEFSQGTEVSVQVEILKNGKVATDKTTNVRMIVTCEGKRISFQSIQLNAGKASFGAFTVKAVGNCSAMLETELTSTKTIRFVVKEQVDLNLPPKTPNGGNPTSPDGEAALPTFKEMLTIGKPFSINSNAALKVQPNSLCENSIMLIYYDGSKVMEALTSGVHVPAVNGKIAGLTFISIEQPPNIDKCGGEKGKLTVTQDKVITMSIMPGYPQGVAVNLSMPSNPPNLRNVSFSNSGGKIKLSWGEVVGFTNGAEIFFSNSDTGNEFTKHTDAVSWTNNSYVTATHNYSRPVRALIRVNLSSNTYHWLYFSS